jgi:hypothetical protein
MIPTKTIFSLADTSLMHKFHNSGINHRDLKNILELYTYIKLDDPRQFYFTVDTYKPTPGYFTDCLPVYAIGQDIDYADLVIYIKKDVKQAYFKLYADMQKDTKKQIELTKKTKALEVEIQELKSKLNIIKNLA